MSEAIWIELIKVLPAFLWIGFGFIALAVAKRIFTAQAPRMTKVETPWVTVELAQQAIEQAAEQAAGRGPAPIPPPAEPDWASRYPLPTQPFPRGDGTVYSIGPAPASPPVVPSPPAEPADEDLDDTVQTAPPEPDPAVLATPPADGAEAPRPVGDRPPTLTAPNRQAPNIPPTYPVLAPTGGSPYYHAPGQTAPYWAQPARAYPAYQPDNRSRRAATKLALAAPDLQGGAILWVDDHPEWNETLVRLFRTAGITVETALSTDDAMRAFQRRSFDLVITDMRREGEPDGDTAGTKLLDRMVASGIPTPAVILSSNPNAHTALHPRAITTTNVPEKLIDIVVEFVGDRRRDQSAGGGSTWIDRLTGN